MVKRATALYAGAQLLPAPLLWQLSDRVGRRPALLGCIGAGSLALLMGGLARSIARAADRTGNQRGIFRGAGHHSGDHR